MWPTPRGVSTCWAISNDNDDFGDLVVDSRSAVSMNSFKNNTYDPERMMEVISRSSSMKLPRFREITTDTSELSMDEVVENVNRYYKRRNISGSNSLSRSRMTSKSTEL